MVADEVRKLAERVTSATKDIAGLIENVQKGVTESIKSAEDGTKEVAEGAQLAEEAGKALSQILRSVRATRMYNCLHAISGGHRWDRGLPDLVQPVLSPSREGPKGRTVSEPLDEEQHALRGGGLSRHLE